MIDSAHAALPAPRADALPRKLRSRLAALSIAGALMVALPLGQVLRYQAAESQTLAQQRAGLDPMARAVAVQRGLLAHRDVAARVLRGRTALEPERRLRQAEVDDRVTTLDTALAAGGWDRAGREAGALHEDWSLLAQQIMARSVSAGDSDQAHRLLLEQALQVVDLLADNGATRSAQPDDGTTAAALAAVRSLPRLATQLSALAAADAAALPRDLAAAEAALARALGALNAGPVSAAQPPAFESATPTATPTAAHSAADAAADAAARAAGPTVAMASAAAGAAADHYFERLRRAGPARHATGHKAADEPSAATTEAAAAAVQAQFALFDSTVLTLHHHLAARMAATQHTRSRAGWALAGLGLLVLTLAGSLWRDLGRLRGARAGIAADTHPAAGGDPGRSAHRAAAGVLLQRLRKPDAALACASASPPAPAAAPTREPHGPPPAD